MNLLFNPIALTALVALYFGVAWFFPWELFQGNSTISVAYVWDALFALIVGLLYRLKPRIGDLRGTLPRAVVVLILAAASLYFLHNMEQPTPFRYLEKPFLQLLALAPVLEEIVFRYAILGASVKALRSNRLAILCGSVLFSLSHLPALWHLPPEFRFFVWVQLAYTFAMGWVIGKAQLRSQGTLEPILLHFLFNLCFYWAVVKGWI